MLTIQSAVDPKKGLCRLIYQSSNLTLQNIKTNKLLKEDNGKKQEIEYLARITQ